MTDLYICEHSRSPCAACAEAARVPWLRAEVRRLQALADARLVEIEALEKALADSEVNAIRVINEMTTVLHVTKVGHEQAFTQSQEKSARIDALERENTALREAANDAATSLETISRLSGRAAYIGDDGKHIPTYMCHHHEVRAYAAARASVARSAIDEAIRQEVAQSARSESPQVSGTLACHPLGEKE